jgi:hypothetical protein
MDARARSWGLAAVLLAAVVAFSAVGRSAAQAGDPVVVTVNSPPVTAPGSQVTFSTTTNEDYLVDGQGIALVAEPAAPPPPDGGNGSGGGSASGSAGGGAVAGVSQPGAVTVTQPVAAATPVRATARFTG